MLISVEGLLAFVSSLQAFAVRSFEGTNQASEVAY
jgi:hypothetical protein